MDELRFESAAITVQRTRAARLLSILGFLGLYGSAALLSILFWNPRDPGPWILATYALWLVPWIASYAVWFWKGSAAGRLTIGPTDIQIQRGSTSRTCPRAAIASAYAGAFQDRPFVEIVLRDGDVFRVEASTVSDADAIVHSLGFGPGGRVQTVELASRGRRLLHLAVGFASYQLTAMVAMPIFLLAFVFFTSFGTVLLPIVFALIGLLLPFVYREFKKRTRAPIVEIGDDGVAITRGKKRAFHPRGTVFGGRSAPGSVAVLLSTAHGDVVVNGSALDPGKALAVVHAMSSRWSATPTAHTRAASFARLGRPLAAWQSDLRVRVADAGYRGDAITLEDADAVLRSPTAPADTRIGAALALAAAGQRTRVAEAALPLADTRLRVALEAVAEGREDLAVETALAALSAPTPSK